MSLKNSSEQIRITPVASGGHSQTTVTTGNSDLKIKSEKVYDTSSSQDLFSGLSVGNVILMSGWNYSENNRVFIVTDIESGGYWIKVDKELINEGDAPGSITIEKSPESLTVSGVTTSDVVVDVINANSTSSSAEEADASKARVTSADTVSSFIVADTGDDMRVVWADLSQG